MDNGRIEIFTGFRVAAQHCPRPARAAFANAPDVTLDEVRALASWMTWKWRVSTFPLRRKGGVICDPKSMSQGELEPDDSPLHVGDRFIGPEKDVPGSPT